MSGRDNQNPPNAGDAAKQDAPEPTLGDNYTFSPPSSGTGGGESLGSTSRPSAGTTTATTAASSPMRFSYIGPDQAMAAWSLAGCPAPANQGSTTTSPSGPSAPSAPSTPSRASASSSTRTTDPHDADDEKDKSKTGRPSLALPARQNTPRPPLPEDKPRDEGSDSAKP